MKIFSPWFLCPPTEQQDDPTTNPEQTEDPDATGPPSVKEPAGVEEEEDTDPQCSPWDWGECQPLDGECGSGVKMGVRVGEGCKKTQKGKPCTVRCGGGNGRGKGKGGRRKGRKQVLLAVALQKIPLW